MPTLLCIAGPNGAGKSTISATLRDRLFRGIEIVDPDALASREQRSVVGAGRVAVEAVERAMTSRSPFVVETTLAGSRGVRLLKRGGQLGYRVALFFVCVESPEVSLQRIAARVALGGHTVPESDVRRRFVRSLERLPEAVASATEFALLDNTDESGPRTIAHGFGGRVLHRDRELPVWARALRLLDELDRA